MSGPRTGMIDEPADLVAPSLLGEGPLTGMNDEPEELGAPSMLGEGPPAPQ